MVVSLSFLRKQKKKLNRILEAKEVLSSSLCLVLSCRVGSTGHGFLPQRRIKDSTLPTWSSIGNTRQFKHYLRV